MAGWEKEVILTWQTCSNIIIVILVMISLAMTTCLSKGNLWKSMGQSTAKLIREEYLVDFKGVLMENKNLIKLSSYNLLGIKISKCEIDDLVKPTLRRA